MTAHEGSAGPRQAMPMALSRLTSMSVGLHHYLDEFLVEARSEAVSVQVHLERVALGGTMHIKTVPERGTVVVLRLVPGVDSAQCMTASAR